MKLYLVFSFFVFLFHFGHCTFSVNDQAFIDAALNKHNEWRSNVSKGTIGDEPGGTNIRKMQWDQGLAITAYQYSDYLCTNDLFTHNGNRVSQAAANGYTGGSVGENLAWGSSQTSTIAAVESLIDMWYNEHPDYTYGTCCGGNFADYGHYTQGVWHNSYMLGCGFVTCSNGRYLTCNYGTAGNYGGQTPYTTGNNGCTGNSCPSNWFCEGASGLCVTSPPSPTRRPTPLPTPRPTTGQPTTVHPTPGPVPTPRPTPPTRSPTRRPTPTPPPVPSSQTCTGVCWTYTMSLSVALENSDTCDQWALAFSTMIDTFTLHMARFVRCRMIEDGYAQYNLDKLKTTWRVTEDEINQMDDWFNNNDWFAEIHYEMNLIRGGGSPAIKGQGAPIDESKSGQPCQANEQHCGPEEKESDSNKAPTGLIIGVVLASVCLCGLILAGFFWYHRNKTQSTAYFELQGQDQSSYAPPNQP